MPNILKLKPSELERFRKDLDTEQKVDFLNQFVEIMSQRYSDPAEIDSLIVMINDFAYIMEGKIPFHFILMIAASIYPTNSILIGSALGYKKDNVFEYIAKNQLGIYEVLLNENVLIRFDVNPNDNNIVIIMRDRKLHKEIFSMGQLIESNKNIPWNEAHLYKQEFEERFGVYSAEQFDGMIDELFYGPLQESGERFRASARIFKKRK